MYIVRIEHPVQNFDAWKAVFDSDPANRRESGVRRYRIMRGIDDPELVLIDLEFDAADVAERFLATMRRIWQSRQATAVLGSSPQGHVFEVIEQETLDAPAG